MAFTDHGIRMMREELEFCIQMWSERGGCSFGGGSRCDRCAAPYLLYKMITGNALSGKGDRLSLKEWRALLKE